MNKQHLRKELKQIKNDYVGLNTEGKKALKNIVVKHYADSLDNPDLKNHLIKHALLESTEEENNKELDWFEDAESIIEAFEYDLTLLEENELIESISGKEKYKQVVKYQKDTSKAFIDRADIMSSNAIAEFHRGLELNDFENDIQATGLDAIAISEAIQKQNELLKQGDITSLERMLNSQTQALNSIFYNMAIKMHNAKYIEHVNQYSKIALKCQNQTRQTIATLAEIKGIKKSVFIKQTNHANNQQINNSENLNDTANEKGFNHVDRSSEADRAGQNLSNQTMALSERQENTAGTKEISHECTQAWNEVGKVAGVRETISRA